MAQDDNRDLNLRLRGNPLAVNKPNHRNQYRPVLLEVANDRTSAIHAEGFATA